MNYEQKYKEALAQAKQELEACGSLDCDAARQIFRLFPELKKSEDERIKDNILKLLRFVRDTYHQYFDDCNEAIEWIEKKYPNFKVSDLSEDEDMREGLINFLKGFKDTTVVSKWIEWLEKNPIFNMPRIEFKVGDWVIFKNGTPESVYQVEKIENFAYIIRHILGGSMPLSFYSQSLIRSWNILDDKVGDIIEFEDHGRLVIGIISFINRASERVDTYCLLEEDKFKVGTFYNLDTINPHPVNTEQRKLFFKKMKEAGYKWDDIKKELIKYEQ